jgi:hypothetical protein
MTPLQRKRGHHGSGPEKGGKRRRGTPSLLLVKPEHSRAWASFSSAIVSRGAVVDRLYPGCNITVATVLKGSIVLETLVDKKPKVL